MEVGTHVWLRSSNSQWGWIPAVIIKKEAVKVNNDAQDPNENSASDSKDEYRVVKLTFRTEHDDANRSMPYQYRYNGDMEDETEIEIEVDQEQLKTVDHDDIKLRNKDFETRSAGMVKESGMIASPVSLVDPNIVGGVNDLIGLTHLHEPSILHALRLRYNHDIIYTSTGPILIAVNPFKSMSHLYNDDVMETYRKRGESISQPQKTKKKKMVEKLPPHVYQTADDAYRSMMIALESYVVKSKKIFPNSFSKETPRIYSADQSILVSGESGAGKTVTTKIVLNYLAMLSKRKNEPSSPYSSKYQRQSSPMNDSYKDRSIEQQVLESNPILESFGNARTIRNDNSSRFGKFIDVRFTTRGKLSGASIETYLLEKVRIIHPGQGERNYHIFYQFLEASMDDTVLRDNLLLDELTIYDFRLLSQTGTFDRRDNESDKDKYYQMMKAMETIGFDSDTIENIMRLITAILFAGNMSFSRVESAHHESCLLEENDDSIAAASLLGVHFDKLSTFLTSRKISAGFEQLRKLLSLEQATKGLEALMKAIYGAIFDYVVKRINNSILEEHERNGQSPHTSNQALASIGVLDIFGFESFDINGFEQICINYTNEALQQQFNKFVFKLEQQLYEREGILWKSISFPDNQDVLDLIDSKHIGILALLDEQCIVPASTDQKFTRYLYSKCGDHNRFIASSTQRVNYLFSIKHYAGDVEYTTDHWLEKNKDELPAGSAQLIMNSNFSFLTNELKPFFRLEQSKNRTLRRQASSLVTKSVAAQFAQQLKTLRSRIDLTVPHYIRCLKPNDELVPNLFQPKNVVEQLRCGGVLEAVKVSRAGYPTRYHHDVFLNRYGVLMELFDDVGDDVSVLSSWTNFSTNELSLKKLVGNIAFMVWEAEHEMMLHKANLEKARRNKHLSFDETSFGGNSKQTRTKQNKMKTLAVESTTMGPEFKSMTRRLQAQSQAKNITKSERPESAEEFLSLNFSTRCAIAGLQLGRTKVFLRREAFERIESMRSQTYYKASTIIQSNILRYVYRKRFLDLKKSTIYLQSIWRMALVTKRKQFMMLIQKTILIQSVWRRAIIRHTVWSCYLEIKNAAITIQRGFRNKYYGTKSAIIIQAWFRGMLQRAAVSRVLISIVKIQALFRGARARFNAIDSSNEENIQVLMRTRMTRMQSFTSAIGQTTPRKLDVKKTPFKVNPNIAVRKTKLYQLIQDESWSEVESILDKHPELAEEVEPSSGELPLHIIARHRGAWSLLVDMILVLYPKALVCRDRMGALPIHHAAAHDNLAALEIVHSAYKDGINEVDSQGRLPIHVAAEFDAVESVKYILAKAPEGAYTMTQSNKATNGGGLPLHVACRNYASIGVITAFLAENFASAKKTDENGDLPLHLLLRCGKSVDQVVVKTLLTCFSAAVTRTDMYGMLPLQIALKSECKASVINTILVQNPETASVIGPDGHSCLHLAFKHNADDRTILGILNHAPELATVVDKKTLLLPIQLATKYDHSPFIVHNLLKRDLPIDLKEKVRAQLVPHHYSWNHIVNDTNDMYHMVVNKLLQQCTQPQVLALAHVEGPDGQIALASATPVCKYELRVMLRLFNTLEVVNQRPAYTNPASDTQIFYALRYNPPPTQHRSYTVLHEDKRDDDYIEDFDDTSLMSGNSKSSSHSAMTARSQHSVNEKLRQIRKEKGQQVIAKLTSRADVVERDLKVRKDYQLSRHYVPAIISVHHTVQHAAYSEAMAEPGYCITMEGADTTAENLILDLRKSGKKFPTKALKRIGISLLHMHEHGIVHCDFGTHNIGKFGSRWKLLGVGASVAIGHKTDPRRGFYHPPESIVVETKRTTLGKKTSEAYVRSINADTTYDIWAYGVVLFEAIAGRPLGPYSCRGKREMTQAEVAKIGKWDDHYLRKNMKAVEIHDEIAKDLLKTLLHGDPRKRYSSMRDVLEHPFFTRDITERSTSRRHQSSIKSSKYKTSRDSRSVHTSKSNRDSRSVRTSQSSRHGAKLRGQNTRSVMFNESFDESHDSRNENRLSTHSRDSESNHEEPMYRSSDASVGSKHSKRSFGNAIRNSLRSRRSKNENK